MQAQKYPTWPLIQVPNDWNIGIVIQIHKKGDTRTYENYRGITLLILVSKLFEK